MADPYKILGVERSATETELKSAYRKLAKKLHPDVNPGRKDIEQKFKEVTSAYDLLSDKAKRAQFDRGEIDDQGNPRGFGGGGGYGGGDPFGGGPQWRNQGQARGGKANFDHDPFASFGGAEDIFAEFLNKRGRGPSGPSAPLRGEDVTYSLAVPFVEATLGGKRRVTLASGKTIDVGVPPATQEGDKLRLRGQGQQSVGAPGDAIIEIHIEPHPWFTRKDSEIHLEVPVSLPEAVGGASVKVPTLEGHVTVKVPKGANTGTVLRLKGKGVPTGKENRGDMFVKLKIMLPDPLPEDFVEIIEKWAKKNAYNPRAKLGWE